LKVRGKVAEISFGGKFLRKAMKSQEIRRNSLALLLHNTVHVVVLKHCLNQLPSCKITVNKIPDHLYLPANLHVNHLLVYHMLFSLMFYMRHSKAHISVDQVQRKLWLLQDSLQYSLQVYIFINCTGKEILRGLNLK